MMNVVCQQDKHTYQLKGGEEIREGKLYGWTGRDCLRCKGMGQVFSEAEDNEIACRGCGGTGEGWGLMPVQPANLPQVP